MSFIEDDEEYNPFDNNSAAAFDNHHAQLDDHEDGFNDDDYSDGELDLEEQKQRRIDDAQFPQPNHKAAAKAKRKAKKAAEQYETGGVESVGLVSGDANVGAGEREKALARREAAVEKREAKVRDREAQVRKMAGSGSSTMDNWPCKCYPLAYHSIADEIPHDEQPLVRKFYFLVRFTWLCLLMNFMALSATWFEGDDDGDKYFLWSLIFMLFGVPLSWKLWYRSVYYATRDNTSRRWVFFFINFFIHMAFSVLMVIGVPEDFVAGSGIILMSDQFAKSNDTAGFMCLVGTAFWGINILCSLYLIKRAHTTWRVGGGEEALKKSAAKAALKHGAK